MKNILALTLTISAAGALSLSAAPDLSKLPPAAKTSGLTFEKNIKPMFEAASCTRCHGNERPKAGLKLTSLEGVLKGTKDGDKVVIPGKSAESPLVVAVAQIDPETAMPPKRHGSRGPGGSSSGSANGGQSTHRPQSAAGPGGQGHGPMGPPPKPLTAEQVGLVRAWIDQGAK